MSTRDSFVKALPQSTSRKYLISVTGHTAARLSASSIIQSIFYHLQAMCPPLPKANLGKHMAIQIAPKTKVVIILFST